MNSRVVGEVADAQARGDQKWAGIRDIREIDRDGRSQAKADRLRGAMVVVVDGYPVVQPVATGKNGGRSGSEKRGASVAISERWFCGSASFF